MTAFFPTYRRRVAVAVSLAALTLGGCSAPSVGQEADTPPVDGAGGESPASDSLPQSGGGVSSASLKDRLAQWLLLVGPQHATAQDYADFLAQSPVWPRRQLIAARMEQALATETDQAVLARLCQSQKLSNGRALAQCHNHLPADRALFARLQAEATQAWINGNDTPVAVAALTEAFPTAITPDASWKRFERQESAGQVDAARRTLIYLAPERQALGEAMLAFRAGDPSAEALASALPSSLRATPALVLDHARWLRKAKQYDAAIALWKSTGVEMERRTHASAFWHERDTLARELLQQSRPADAFMVANDTVATGANRLDAQFLSGWIALRKMQDPSTAQEFFRPLTLSSSLLTRSRGYYWLGRALAQSGDTAAAQSAWQSAAALPTTFYGQMAAASLDGQQTVLLDQPYISKSMRQRLQTALAAQPSISDGGRLATDDLAQAARLLVDQGDRPHARDFLAMLLRRNSDAAGLEDVSGLADSLGLQDIAVAAARLGGKDGTLLLRSGWPAPYTPPASALPPGFVLGLMRQESSFNPDAVSSSNAIGLMQLKPSTAADMLHLAGLPASAATATGLRNPENNMQLGTAYLQHMQDRFGPVMPYMAAAYNAGPGRMGRWLETAGNPAQGHATDSEMIDWIEGIPFSETRNYVQRVWENMTVYVVLGKLT